MEPQIVKDQDGKMWQTSKEAISRETLVKNVFDAEQTQRMLESNLDSVKKEVATRKATLEQYDAAIASQAR
jgi:hypothetical protein